MKRTLFAIVTVAAVMAAAAPAFAQDGMKLGLGYFRPEAPVGGRAWINEKTAVDFGVGLSMREVTIPSGQDAGDTENKLSFTVDAGVPFVLAGDETTKFFLRPGITFSSSPVWDAGENDWASATQFWISGSLGAEHWFGKHFSLSAAHGLVFKTIDPGVEGSDSSSGFDTEAFGINNIGFHYYFN